MAKKKYKVQLDKKTLIDQQIIKVSKIPSEVHGLLVFLTELGYDNGIKKNKLVKKILSARCPKCRTLYDGEVLLMAYLSFHNPHLWKDEKLSRGRCDCGSKKIILFTNFKPEILGH